MIVWAKREIARGIISDDAVDLASARLLSSIIQGHHQRVGREHHVKAGFGTRLLRKFTVRTVPGLYRTQSAFVILRQLFQTYGLRFNMGKIRFKQERKMATQNPNRLGTNFPGGSLTLGGDTTINRLGFGAMRLCGPGVWGEPLDLLGAKRVLTRAVELGITLIDTADAYGPEVNERFIAETLYPYPKGLIVATKGGLVRPRREAWERNGRPEHLRAACEASLRRLKLERIDIYQLHAPDPQVPLDESVGALAELQSEGKIRHIGLSNVSVNELRRAQHIAPIVSVQNRYNFSERLSEDVLAECEKGGLAFLPWHPLAAGGDAAGGGALGRVARRLGATLVQVAIAWLLARSPVMVPIPGTSSLAHLDENVAAAQISLSTEDLHELS